MQLSGRSPHAARAPEAHRASGFTVERQLLSAEQSAELRAAFDQAMVDSTPFMQNGSGGSRARSHAEEHVTFATLIASDALHRAVEIALGHPPLFFGSFLMDNRDDTPWHTGSPPGEGLPGLRASVHLDATATSHYLSVIPGSHHADYSRALFDAHGRFDGPGLRLDLPPEGAAGALAIPAGPRDVVLWDPRLWHAAFRTRESESRRGVFVTYLPDPGEDRLLAEKTRRAFSALSTYDRPYVYAPALREHPSFATMGERLTELGVKRVWP